MATTRENFDVFYRLGLCGPRPLCKRVDSVAAKYFIKWQQQTQPTRGGYFVEENMYVRGPKLRVIGIDGVLLFPGATALATPGQTCQ